MNKDKWKIKEIRVEGLLNRHDLHWLLKSKVNILGGPNGSGKSTLLHAVAMLLKTLSSDTEENRIHCEALFKQLEIVFESGATARLERSARSTSERYEQGDDAITSALGRRKEKVREEVAFRTELESPAEGQEETSVNVLYINSSDYALGRLSQLLEKSDMNERPALSVLDILLENALNERNRLFAQRLSRAMQKGDEREVAYLRELFSRFDKAVMDFMPEYKLIDPATLSFALRDGSTDEIIRYFRMATGEKQLLYVLLTVSNTLEEPTVLLLDEADTGMHVDWKKMLLRKLLEINPDMQIIAATHSPSLINGWYDSVKEISQLYVSSPSEAHVAEPITRYGSEESKGE